MIAISWVNHVVYVEEISINVQAGTHGSVDQ